jgi:hypothetical protein
LQSIANRLCQSLSGFLRQCVGKTSKTHCSEVVIDGGKCAPFAGTDVSYDDIAKSVAKQIENEVFMDINSPSETMIAFLQNGMGLQQRDINPFLDPLPALSPRLIVISSIFHQI